MIKFVEFICLPRYNLLKRKVNKSVHWLHLQVQFHQIGIFLYRRRPRREHCVHHNQMIEMENL